MTMACIKPEADIGLETKPTIRKRRRRTTTAGAADDCFMCQKRNAPCDRRRPYCGQCLEIGKDCSGYKTTLTWGVGIASRGKLRGLTCPVAEKTDGPVGVTKRNSVSQPRRKASTTVPASERPIPPRIDLSTNTVPPTSQEPLHTPSYGLLSPLDPPQPVFWQPLQQYANHELTSPTSPYDTAHIIHQRNPSEFPLTPVSLSYNEGLQSSANYSLMDPSPQSCAGSYPPQSTFYADPPLDTPTVAEDLTFSQGQDAFAFEPTATYNANSTEFDQAIQSQDFEFSNLDLSLTNTQQPLDSLPELTISIPKSMAPSLFYHLSPRMQYLLNYYDKHICSVLVAFDDTINPYRMHILQLATHNEGLQNALAALSLNNMRMRLHKRAPPSGFIEELDGSLQDSNNSILARPTPEESYYKSVSIGQLQAQLADAVSAQDDSVLAILLILCLFHVSDSGFSKFKTQLEGVQRLLSMRDPGVRTGFIGWVEMFFAWFDVMTSTVNDRETEIQGDRLDMLHYSSNLGALEQFSGCDGRLFKLIARLGRLNLLSQNRPVRPDPRNSKASYGATSTPKYKDQNTFPTTRGWRPQFDPVDFSRLDGNGWGALLADLPDDLDTVYREATDTRQEFWKEWHDIRSRLESWSMDSPCLSPTAPDTSAASLELGQRDLTHINESFRSSALLYTERLAHPFLPSSSPKFQAHVRNALSHIAALDITSCVNKFLLWPLFISGTECVDAADQALVRDRCIEVQIESGFFNNLSVLDVLEKVWAENDTQDVQDADFDEVQRRRDSAKENGDRIQAFRWRKAMDRVDGEYLVI